jgi:hypothetical protein
VSHTGLDHFAPHTSRLFEKRVDALEQLAERNRLDIVTLGDARVRESAADRAGAGEQILVRDLKRLRDDALLLARTVLGDYEQPVGAHEHELVAVALRVIEEGDAPE